MKQWIVKWCSGGELWATHPDDPDCNIMAYCNSDLEELGRWEERTRGLPRAEFPHHEYRIVRVK